MLSHAQISQFTEEAFVKIPKAFPRELADLGRSILWRDTGGDEAVPPAVFSHSPHFSRLSRFFSIE